MNYVKYTLAGIIAVPTTVVALNKIYTYVSHSPPALPKNKQPSVQIFNKNSRQDPKLIQELIDCMAVSFCGTKDKEPEQFMNWALGTSLSISPEAMEYNYNYEANLTKRLLVLRWTMSYLTHELLLKGNGSILYIRTPDGNIGAASVIQYENTTRSFLTKCNDAVTKLLVLVRIGLPPWGHSSTNDPLPVGLELRLDKGGAFLKRFHHHWTEGLHVYTYIMATHPNCQGRGYCSKIMRTTVALGEEQQLDVYLETGGVRNQTVYARFGYDLVEEKELILENDSEPNLTYSAMLKKYRHEMNKL